MRVSEHRCEEKEKTDQKANDGEGEEVRSILCTPQEEPGMDAHTALAPSGSRDKSDECAPRLTRLTRPTPIGSRAGATMGVSRSSNGGEPAPQLE